MNNNLRLLVAVVVDSRTLNVELHSGASLVLGRSTGADIHIDESSVSSEHLKLTFSGTMLRVQDLGSSNGTFRMPSEAPFLEAEFSVTNQSLNLKLGFQTEITLSWHVKSDAKELTKTEFEQGDLRASEDVMPKAELKVAAAKASEQKSATKSLPVEPAAKAIHTNDIVAGVRKQTSVYFKFFALLVYSAVVLALSKVLWQSDLGFVDEMVKEQRGVGLGIDILAVSLSGYALRGWLISALSLVLAYVFYRFWIKPTTNFKLRIMIGVWAIVVSIWPLVYPFVLAARNGVGMVHLNALRSSQQIFETSAYTLDEKSQKFAELLPHLVGSSYFYAKVVNMFFERVVDECGGAWKDDWNKKKLCLVLINSVSVEALTDMQPRVLNPVALRLVLITSLDSIMRIFPVEGPESEMNEVFIKSVESVGLKEEAARIRSILTSSKTSAPQKLDSLQKLKMSVEMRMDSLNVELQLPDVMRITPPDILALGI